MSDDIVTVEAAREVVLSADTKDVATGISEMRAGNRTLISSIETTDFDSKLAVVDAITNSEALDDNLGKTINLTHFVAQLIEMADERTGEMVQVPRTILIDADGTAYHAISLGVFSGLENLVGVLGKPSTWPHPVKIHVLKRPAKVGKVMVIKLGDAPKK